MGLKKIRGGFITGGEEWDLMPDMPGVKFQCSNLSAGNPKQITYISLNVHGCIYEASDAHILTF
jgi:hypothetical protein